MSVEREETRFRLRARALAEVPTFGSGTLSSPGESASLSSREGTSSSSGEKAFWGRGPCSAKLRGNKILDVEVFFKNCIKRKNANLFDYLSVSYSSIVSLVLIVVENVEKSSSNDLTSN